MLPDINLVILENIKRQYFFRYRNQRRQYAERTAINAPTQGSAADIIKRAMISVDHALANSKADVKVVMQLDEISSRRLGRDACK